MLLRVSTYIALVVITGMTAHTDDAANPVACSTSALPEIRIALETPQDALRLIEWAKNNKLALPEDMRNLHDANSNLVKLASAKLETMRQNAGNSGQTLHSLGGISLPEGLRISHWKMETSDCKN